MIEIVENEIVVEIVEAPEIVIEVGDGMVLPEWGMIRGDIENQGDLMEELDLLWGEIGGKADRNHDHDDRYYSKEDVNSLLSDKADADDVYTKQETDAALADKADSDDVYNKAQMDIALAGKVDSEDMIAALALKANQSDVEAELAYKADSDEVAEAFQRVNAALSQKADKSGVYSKQETDSALALKADAIVREVSGNQVRVSDASGAPVLGLSVDVAAVQSGSGDASPSNIRPISGWAGTDLTVNGASVPVSFPSSAGTVYGGMLNVKSGILTVTHVGVDLGSLDWIYDSPYTRFSSLLPVESKDRTIRRVWYRCSCYKVISNGTSLANVPNFSTYIGFGMNELRIYVHDSRYSTVEEFQPAVLGQMIVYEIASPVTYQLTPVEVNLLLGQNTVSADCGPVTLRYCADTKLYIDGKFAELQALILEN